MKHSTNNKSLLAIKIAKYIKKNYNLNKKDSNILLKELGLNEEKSQ